MREAEETADRQGALALRPSTTQRATVLPASGLWIDLAILGAFTAILAAFVVPSHWESIWMDRAFTGTVTSLANRLQPGTKLYTDGTHIPMPPLPFLLVRLLTNGHATWLWESGLNFSFQALTLLLMYLALRKLLEPPVPFLAIMVSVPAFYSLRKTVLYDSMAQATVALLVLLATVALGREGAAPAQQTRTVRGLLHRSRLLPLLGLAITSALLLLIKQSTGIGAFLGTAAAMLLCDRGPWRSRLYRAGVYGLLTGLSLISCIALITPWADGPGLIRDVFVTGSEPKGGALLLIQRLARYPVYIGDRALLLLLPLVAFLGLTGWACRRASDATRYRPEGLGGVAPAHFAILSVTCCSAMLVLAIHRPWVPPASLVLVRPLDPMAWAGLLLAAALALRCVRPGLLRDIAPVWQPWTFASVFVVALGAAVFHSLSWLFFNWTADNNPLVPVSYAALFLLLLRALGCLPHYGLRVALIAIFCFAVVPFRPWGALGEQLRACLRCTDTWAEIRFLSGARLSPSAAGMRHLVEIVRREARPDDQVLLLPADPNVEAWFERDRPSLSSLMLFVDQYWDRYVDGDFAVLQARPPKVIVIGPLNYWRRFHRYFYRDRGAERLVDRVTDELLPACYQPLIAVPILHRGLTDTMVVYVRRD